MKDEVKRESKPVKPHIKFEPKFAEVDVQIGVALAAGYTHKEIAQRLNVSDRTICNFKERRQPFITLVADLAKPFMRTSAREVEQIVKDKVNERLEALLGMATAALEDAVQPGVDLALRRVTANDILNRVVGRPASTMKLEGEINHKHAHFAMPEGTARAFALDAARDMDLHSKAALLRAGDVIDVEPS